MTEKRSNVLDTDAGLVSMFDAGSTLVRDASPTLVACAYEAKSMTSRTVQMAVRDMGRGLAVHQVEHAHCVGHKSSGFWNPVSICSLSKYHVEA